MIRRTQWLFVCALFAGGTALPCARAAPAEPSDCLPLLSVEVDSCTTISAAEVRRLLAIELGAPESLRGEPKPGRDLMRAQIRCGEHAAPGTPGRVELRIDRHARAHALGREVDLSHQDPAVHPRLIAVALAELLFASSAEQQRPSAHRGSRRYRSIGGLGLSAAVARVRIDLLLEFGYVLWKVAAKVDGARVSAIEGPWLGLSLGLGLGELHLHR